MIAVNGTGEICAEPHWRLLLSDDLEIEAAADHWRRVTTEMRDRNILAPSNGHAVQRLVLSYVIFDRSSREVAENGAVTKPKRGNKTAIARLSPHYAVMREAASDAAGLEAELGLSPRRRSQAAKVDRASRSARPSDAYLRPVAK